MIPKGEGMFIWLLYRLGTPEKLAEYCKKLGLDWVAIKAQNGVLVSDGRTHSEFEKQQPDPRVAKYYTPEDYVSALRGAGIDVHGWGYVYGYDHINAKEQANTLAVIDRFKFETFIINAEVEYKHYANGLSYANKMASRYAGGLRVALPGYDFGITTYRFIKSYHSDFPIEPFANVCSYTVPQVYWIGAHNPASQLERTVNEYRQVRSDWTIIPAGSAYPDSANNWFPTLKDLNEFYNKVIEMKLQGWLWWELYYVMNDATYTAALIDQKSTVEPTQPTQPAPIEPSDAEKLARLWQAHPELH